VDIQTLEFLKWFVGVPAAVASVVTLPFIVRKYHLECKKLILEIQKLKQQIGYPQSRAVTEPGRWFVWFALYWVIPCYGSLALFVSLGFILRSEILTGMGFALSLVFFVWGSAVSEHYESIRSKN